MYALLDSSGSEQRLVASSCTDENVLRFQHRWRVFWILEQLLASEEEMCCMVSIVRKVV